MRICEHGNRKRITVDPGEYYVTDRDAIISTLLGSCVSVCMYDPVCHVMGMNHFLISTGRYSDEDISCHLDPGRHGICAMDSLISGMLEKGAKRKNLHAKVFGGGSMFRPYDECGLELCVGKSNTEFVIKFLKLSHICVTASDTGGDFGRLIRFSFGDYYVYVKKIRKLGSRLISRDQLYWNRLESTDAAPSFPLPKDRSFFVRAPPGFVPSQYGNKAVWRNNFTESGLHNFVIHGIQKPDLPQPAVSFPEPA